MLELINPSEGNISHPKDFKIGYLPQEMEHNEGATIFDEAYSAFDEISKLEARVEEITRDLEVRTDYESDRYSRIIDELTECNTRLDVIGGGNIEEKIQRILQGLGFCLAIWNAR